MSNHVSAKQFDYVPFGLTSRWGKCLNPVTGKNKHRKKSKGKRGHKNNKLTTSYSGPFKLPSSSDVETITVNKSFGFLDGTSVAGILTNSFKGSDVTSVADWSNIQSTWKEYSVLAFELEFIPVNPLSSNPISVVCVRDHSPGSSPLTSMSQALAFDNHLLFSSAKLTNSRFGIKAKTIEELQFQLTSGSSNFISIQTYSTAGSISTNYFFVNSVFVLRLRGMK